MILNANIEELGGRVKILISFSGLPADADEAFDLLLAKRMSWGEEHQYRRTILYSENKLARTLLALT